MNTDQLKLIIDAIHSLGVESKSAFIWWLVFEHIPGFIIGIAFISLLGFLANRLTRMYSHTQSLVRLRDILGIGYQGPLTDDQCDRVIESVTKLLEQKK